MKLEDLLNSMLIMNELLKLPNITSFTLPQLLIMYNRKLEMIEKERLDREGKQKMIISSDNTVKIL